MHIFRTSYFRCRGCTRRCSPVVKLGGGACGWGRLGDCRGVRCVFGFCTERGGGLVTTSFPSLSSHDRVRFVFVVWSQRCFFCYFLVLRLPTVLRFIFSSFTTIFLASLAAATPPPFPGFLWFKAPWTGGSKVMASKHAAARPFACACTDLVLVATNRCERSRRPRRWWPPGLSVESWCRADRVVFRATVERQGLGASKIVGASVCCDSQ